jgi:hypothetical protein
MIKMSPAVIAITGCLLFGCGQTDHPVDSDSADDTQPATGANATGDLADAHPGGGGEASEGHAGGHPGGPGGGPGGRPGGPGGPGGRPGGGGQFGNFNPESIFERQDANSDGKVDLAEYTEALKNSPWGRNVSDPEERFRQQDTNGDGVVDLPEFKKVMEAMMQRFSGGRGGRGGRGGGGRGRENASGRPQRPAADDGEPASASDESAKPEAEKTDADKSEDGAPSKAASDQSKSPKAESTAPKPE